MNAYMYSVICAAVLVPLEMLVPMRAQRRLRAGVGCDLLHMAVNAALIPVALQLVAGCVLGISKWVPQEIPDTVNSLPVFWQFVLTFLVAETMFYLAHRIVHAVPFLWRFHAIHHSSDELDFLSAVRGHPVDAVIHWGMVITPLILLGVDPGMFAVYSVVFYIHSYIVHANIGIRLPLLRKIVVTPEFHHSHHERSLRHNYAGMLALLDRLFRSELKSSTQPGDRMTWAKNTNYLAQLLQPFLFFRKDSGNRPV